MASGPAHCAVDLDQAMIVAGFGCRSAITRAEAEAALQAAAEGQAVAVLATSRQRAGEAGLQDLAAALGLPLLAVDDAALKAAAPRCLTHSPRSLAATGLPSLAEAAALAAAGPGSVLLGPRVAIGPVTCALGRG